MHPLARVFQIVFLVGGMLLATVGYIVYYDDFQQTTTIDVAWNCEAKDAKQNCETQFGRIDAGSIGEAQVNMLAGAVLILASGAVAVGGRRRNDGSKSAAPQPAYPAMGPPPPPAPGAPNAPGAMQPPPGPGGMRQF